MTANRVTFKRNNDVLVNGRRVGEVVKTSVPNGYGYVPGWAFRRTVNCTLMSRASSRSKAGCKDQVRSMLAQWEQSPRINWGTLQTFGTMLRTAGWCAVLASGVTQ